MLASCDKKGRLNKVNSQHHSATIILQMQFKKVKDRYTMKLIECVGWGNGACHLDQAGWVYF